jgi:fructokinase
MLIGIDWGGTKIEGVAMERDGRELLRLREATPRHDYLGCISRIRDMIAALEGKTGHRGSIGIGIPGSLEPVSRLGKGASSTWLLGQPVESDLKAALQRDIRVENDADCFAASEAVDGAGVGHNVVFAVILGSGVGAGIAVNGRAHHGPNNSGGEWGHNPLPFPDTTEIPGKACYCGRHGCIETWCSGRAFEAQYTEHKGVERKATEIVELKRKGDHLANLLWHRYIDRVARKVLGDAIADQNFSIEIGLADDILQAFAFDAECPAVIEIIQRKFTCLADQFETHFVSVVPHVFHSFHNHAAPRTPLASPCLLRLTGV